MRVKFLVPFFASDGGHTRKDGQHIHGRHYRAGIHDVPDGMTLPKSAIILDKNAPYVPHPVKPAVNPLHEHDLDRAAGEAHDTANTAAVTEVKRGPGRPKGS